MASMCLLRRPFPHLSMQLPHSSSTSPSPLVFSPLHRQHRGFGTPPANPHRGLEALAPPACSQKCPHSVQSPVLFGLWSETAQNTPKGPRKNLDQEEMKVAWVLIEGHERCKECSESEEQRSRIGSCSLCVFAHTLPYFLPSLSLFLLSQQQQQGVEEEIKISNLTSFVESC